MFSVWAYYTLARTLLFEFNGAATPTSSRICFPSSLRRPKTTLNDGLKIIFTNVGRYILASNSAEADNFQIFVSKYAVARALDYFIFSGSCESELPKRI